MKILVLISVLVAQVWAVENEKLDSIVLKDLMSNSSEKVNIKNSNSAACKKPCTVKSYFSTHFDEIAREIEKIKKTPRKEYTKEFGTSVSSEDDYRTSIAGGCTLLERPNYPEAELKKTQLKLPEDEKIISCNLKFGFAFGENVWSEELQYLKNPKTNAVIPGSFWALGTP